MRHVFVTGSWGRPNGLEANVYRAKQDQAVVRRYPNFDEYDPWLKKAHKPDEMPWNDDEPWDDLAKDYYYEALVRAIERFKPDVVIGCFLEDAVQGLAKKTGIPTLCVNPMSARLENNRWFAKSIASEYGVPTSETYQAETKADALKILDQVWERWNGCVIKFMDSNTIKTVAEVCNTMEEAAAAVHSRPDEWFPSTLEERMEGVEVAFSCLVDGENEKLIPMVTDFEYTKFGTGDVGVEMSEMGSHDIVGVSNRVMREIFEPLMPWFKEVGYKGWLDAGCIFNPDTGTIRVFEFMTRLGSSQFELVMNLMASDFSDVALSFLRGDLQPKDISWRHRHAVSVVAADTYDIVMRKSRRMPITGPVASMLYGEMTEDGDRSLCRMKMFVDASGKMLTNGDVVFNAIGTSNSFREAKELAYSVLREVRFPGMYYRTDIGHRFLNRLDDMLHASVLPAGIIR